LIACNRKREEATGGNRTNVTAWKRRQFFISLIEEMKKIGTEQNRRWKRQREQTNGNG
jgi:hypothetical protein